MKTSCRKIGIIIWIMIAVLLMISVAVSEQAVWNCPECGRTGNTNNYCGGCGHPAPWVTTIQKTPSVGDCIFFGHYEQDNNTGNGPEEIEWIILDYNTSSHCALLISKYALATKPYNAKLSSVTWETCSLRSWLNKDFLNEAFGLEKQKSILTTVVDNSLNQCYDGWTTEGGQSTQDQVFILSYAEAKRYFDVNYDGNMSTAARVAPTAYAIKNGAWANDKFLTVENEAAVNWWLRSPGIHQDNSLHISSAGTIQSLPVNYIGGVVRPAFWIKLDF